MNSFHVICCSQKITYSTIEDHLMPGHGHQPRCSQNDIEDTHGNQHIASEAVASMFFYWPLAFLELPRYCLIRPRKKPTLAGRPNPYDCRTNSNKGLSDKETMISGSSIHHLQGSKNGNVMQCDYLKFWCAPVTVTSMSSQHVSTKFTHCRNWSMLTTMVLTCLSFKHKWNICRNRDLRAKILS